MHVFLKIRFNITYTIFHMITDLFTESSVKGSKLKMIV